MALLPLRLLAFTLFFVTMHLPATAQERIVSLGGDVTEILYGLGAGERIVATDSTSVYPADAAAKPKVGYVRRLSAEGVLSAEPDLILISGAAGPPEAVDQLRVAGVPIVEMETGYTVESVLDKIKRVAGAIGEGEAGEAYAETVSAEWSRAQARIDALGLAPTALFFATLQDGVPQAAGTETAAHGMIDLIGGQNIFSSHTGYKPLSLEAAVAADPDIILVMSHHAARIGTLEDVLNHPAIALTTAAQTDMVFLVDPVTVMQFGPRMPTAIADLAEEVHDRLIVRKDG